MNLQQYVKENPTKTLTEIQAYTVDVLTDADILREYLTLKGKWGNVVAHTANPSDPLFSAASGIIHKVDRNEPISFSAGSTNGMAHIFMINAFVSSGDITTSEANEILALAAIQRFSNVTQSQLNTAKNLYTSMSITYMHGKDIVVTLSETLVEKVAVTTWRVEAGFEDENAGRAVQVQNAQKYRINMQGKKSGNYELRIPLLNVDFSVELA